MPLSTTIPNLGESRLKVIKAGIAANISTLDGIISRDEGGGVRLLPVGTAVAGLVMLGDVQSFPSVADAPFLICVVGGGQRDARDFEAKVLYSGLPANGFGTEFYTNIFCYIHQDLFPASDSAWSSVQAQVLKREDLRARLADFIRGIFNRARDAATNTGFKIVLTSRERVTAPDFDILHGYVRDGFKGQFEKSFGANQSLFGVHLLHVGSNEFINTR